MLKRILTAVVLLPILALCIWFNDAPLPLFAILLTIFCELALKEFYDIAAQLGHKPYRVIGHVSIALMTFSYYATVLLLNCTGLYVNSFVISSILLAVITAVTICWMLRGQDLREGINSCAWTLFGILYLGLLPSFYVLLGSLQDGRFFLIFALVCVFAIDIFSFFVGVPLGRHHFAPRLSPKKTVEGLIGGFAGLIGVAILLNHVMTLGMHIWQVILYCIFLFPMAIFGDLVESYLKRAADLKDSSQLLPGHGGVLDRLDSLIMSGIVSFVLVLILTY